MTVFRNFLLLEFLLGLFQVAIVTSLGILSIIVVWRNRKCDLTPSRPNGCRRERRT